MTTIFPPLGDYINIFDRVEQGTGYTTITAEIPYTSKPKPRPPRMRRHTAKKLLNKMRRKPVHVDLTTGRAASVMAFTRSARGL
jgi:hypothetical protein